MNLKVLELAGRNERPRPQPSKQFRGGRCHVLSLPGQEHGTLNKHMANQSRKGRMSPPYIATHSPRTCVQQPNTTTDMPCPPGLPKNRPSSTRTPIDRRALSGSVTQGCKTVSLRLLPVVLHQPRENRSTRAHTRLEYRSSKRRKHQFGNIYITFPSFPIYFAFSLPSRIPMTNNRQKKMRREEKKKMLSEPSICVMIYPV